MVTTKLQYNIHVVGMRRGRRGEVEEEGEAGTLDLHWEPAGISLFVPCRGLYDHMSTWVDMFLSKCPSFI